jgi:recombination protein RecA
MNSEVLKIAAAINKKLGAGTVLPASQAEMPPRITTGSLTLDVVLGGGWPMNHWVEVIGEASHGKTALALKTIAANQAKDPEFTAVWVAAETFDKDYAAMCGVDNERLVLIETNIMEDAYDSVITFAESKAVDMIVIDSLPALTPGAEDEKTMEEFTVGRGALLTNKFFRKVSKATKRSLVEKERPILGLMINQYRMKIGVMHGDPRTTPGGQGKDYAFSVRCEVKRDEWQEVGTGNDKRRVGQTIKVRTIKNKTFPPQQVAYLDFYFAEGGAVDRGEFDTGKEIVALSILNGIVERRGGWFYYGDRKWQGSQQLVDSIREEVDLKESLTIAVMDTLRSHPVLAIEADDDGEE